MSLPDESTGNLVALEGDVAAIATQLRLLPPSSQILTLPAFASALPKPQSSSSGADKFDAKTYVRQVHETFTKRHDQARSFLKSSTGSQPRLVFLNGGCVSARTACITKIAEELGNGSTQEGERIFEDIVRDGVAGLYKAEGSTSTKSQTDETEAPQVVQRAAGPPSITSEKYFDAKSDHVEATQLRSKELQNLVSESKAASITDARTDDTRPSFEKRTSFGSYTSQQEEKIEDDAEFEEAAEHPDAEPDSDDVVVYGEACVVSVPRTISPRQSRLLRRARSVDVLDRDSSQRPVTPPKAFRRIRSHEIISFTPKEDVTRKRGSSLDHFPRTVYVRRVSNPKAPKKVYVSRGTDAEPEPEPQVEEEAFQPVFPLVEDLVIHFSDGHTYEIFDAVLNSYRNGQYQQERQSATRPTSIATVETDDEGQSRRHENPYASGDRQKFLSTKSIPGVLAPGPLTPAAEAPPLMRYPSTRFERFIDFSAPNAKSSLGIQNAFRAVLAQRFPPALGYKQLPFASETDRFWKPVLRMDEGYTNEGRTIDLILAVGHAERVNRDSFHVVCGQLAQLGSKRNGLSKSSSLDIRFLISSALSALPADSHPTLNASPLTHPTLMAELVVPQLESYLAGNELTRLLILKHEAAHLPLILELRRLMGDDVFKIASLLDPASTSVADPRGASPNLLSNEGTSMLNARSRFTSTGMRSHPVPPPLSLSNSNRSLGPSSSTKRPDDLLSKSNFLVSAGAGDAETREFVESVRKVLVVKNHFFEAEAPLSVPAPAVIAATTATSSVPIAARVINPNRHNRNMSSTSTAAAVAAAAVQAANALPPPPLPKGPSDTAGIKGVRTRSRSRSRGALMASTPRSSEKHVSLLEKENQQTPSSAVVDPWDGFQDSDDDDMDRMYMPTGPKRAQRKPNSRKALKWLGLA